MEDRYLVQVYDMDNPIKSMFIDKVVLKGEKSDLIQKMSSIEYVESLGIHESFFLEKFKLVKESEVDFPY